MILTIRLDDMLRGAVTTPSRNLVTRTTGAAVRGSIERAMAAQPCMATLLDFGSVGLIDFSCADEVVAKLLLVIEDDRYLVLLGVDDSQAEAIDYVLSRRGLAVTALPRAGGRCVLGGLSPDLTVVFEAVQSFGPGNGERLAAQLGWTVERTADALLALALRRLVVAAEGTYAPLPVQ